MYAIAYKETSRSSWKMAQRTFDDREKVDAQLAKLRKDFPNGKFQRVFFEEDI